MLEGGGGVNILISEHYRIIGTLTKTRKKVQTSVSLPIKIEGNVHILGYMYCNYIGYLVLVINEYKTPNSSNLNIYFCS